MSETETLQLKQISQKQTARNTSVVFSKISALRFHALASLQRRSGGLDRVPLGNKLDFQTLCFLLVDNI